MGSASDGWSYILQSQSMGEFADNEKSSLPRRPRQDLTRSLLRGDLALATLGEHGQRAAHTCLIR
jgi:hypothetical protein